jgi:hypothetical protein
MSKLENRNNVVILKHPKYLIFLIKKGLFDIEYFRRVSLLTLKDFVCFINQAFIEKI